MEAVFALVALGLVGLVMAGSLIGLFAWTRTSRLEKRIEDLARELADIRHGLGAGVPGTGVPAGIPTGVPAGEPPAAAAPLPTVERRAATAPTSPRAAPPIRPAVPPPTHPRGA